MVSLGFDVMVEAGLGVKSGIVDDAFREAGADVVTDIDSAVVASDIVLRVRKPSPKDVQLLSENALHVSFLDRSTTGR